ncbi:MAG: glycosyltransferase family 9 protein [Desulfovibrio sp.]|jgi:ADP-heptose:LPS heptosyltransferase|nr:glycosyltransferase family 9 protein [Desulfovibrio sp.]
MSKNPILVLQMQRMGDLALSFPLLAGLGKAFPEQELVVVGEAGFFEPLMSLSPPATYCGYADAARFLNSKFHMVINLSHRAESAALAGRLKSDLHLGPRLDAAGRLFINGDWQLYRASLTNNNHYNLYHWADLNRLDIFSGAATPSPAWLGEKAKTLPSAGARIGLFLGASERDKHPDVGFWAKLCLLLLKAGYRPVLLGGEAEKDLGRETAAKAQAPALNLTGRFSVKELAGFMSGLDFFISPDTGPLHIAACLGLPLLNLSMGPVNPWETGPYAAAQHIVCADLDCAGCWSCTQQRLLCGEVLRADKIFPLIRNLFSGSSDMPLSLQEKLSGLRLWRSRYEQSGLYDLECLFPTPADVWPGPLRFSRSTARLKASGQRNRPDPARLPLSRFWQRWFGWLFGREGAQAQAQSRAALRAAYPDADALIASAAAAFALEMAKRFRTNPENIFTAQDLWLSSPPEFRPFSGYAHMYLQNLQGQRSAFLQVMRLAESLAES